MVWSTTAAQLFAGFSRGDIRGQLTPQKWKILPLLSANDYSEEHFPLVLPLGSCICMLVKLVLIDIVSRMSVLLLKHCLSCFLLIQCGHGSTNDLLRPTFVSSLTGIKVERIAAGLWHTLCISVEGHVYVFGGNQFGQLGTGADQAEVNAKCNNM